MHAELENWNNGWHGLHLRLKPAEIERLMTLLGMLLKDPEQHFHISSDYSGTGGLGDIEFSVATNGDLNNMHMSGLAIASDTEFPQTR